MYEDNNILKRYRRYDTDFTLGNPSLNWNEPAESSSWVYTVVVLLWIIGAVALILCACAQSPSCPWYDWLYKLRHQQYRPHPGTGYNEDVVVGEEPNQSLICPSSPPLQGPQGGGRKYFEDLPPAYSEVVKSDLPPYSQSGTGEISLTIPDREWTSRTRTDNRDAEI